MNRVLMLLGLVLSACTNQPGNRTSNDWPGSFGFGRLATNREIDSLNIDVRPDGTGLPPGSGNAIAGRILYESRCARCHGERGIDGAYGSLVTRPGMDTTGNDRAEKTVGNYWPWSSTIYDYIHRAMPYDQPGSLSNDEVYRLTAYILFENKLIDSVYEINARTLPLVQMPARDKFVGDDRTGGALIR